MKILLGDFNVELGRERDSLHQDSNDIGVSIVNFATSKNLVVTSMMFPQRNIHKYSWTSPNGKTHNQIDRILLDRSWKSSMHDVWSFRGDDCDTDHNLVVAKVRERLAVNKQEAQKFDVVTLNLRKLCELEVRKQYQIKISNRFAALENLNDFQADCMVHLVCVVQYSSFAWVSLRMHVVPSTHTQIQNHENTDN